MPYFQSKEEESYPSSIVIKSSRFPTEVYHSNKVYTKPTQDELNTMGN